MKVYVKVVETTSFTRAAEVLHTSAVYVTRMVQARELRRRLPARRDPCLNRKVCCRPTGLGNSRVGSNCRVDQARFHPLDRTSIAE
ncbi:helix-turn-helix domain-containing protein [Paraburkholderia sp. GAS348]|uniref:helix-turn-helix domain-containing protein n=1 Tax=Paraburkholderia sp. GAS348 TaxID=3035132 RepID=UPI003D2230E8